MGICFGSEADQRSAKLAKELKNDSSNENKVKKLLLLGAGGSGKSTFFKQLRNIHGQGICQNEREAVYRDIVFSNIITSMKTLITENRSMTKQANELNMLEQTHKQHTKGKFMLSKISEKNEDHATFIMNFEEENFSNATAQVQEAITALWVDEGIQSTWHQRSKFQIQDSAQFFFDNMYRICEANYIPSSEDVLRARIRTTGIVEQEFQVKGNKFQVFDVGGQRNERKKWIHCFEHVTGVLFLAALSAYDQTLYEDDQTNRMREALDLFKQISNSRWFKGTAMILFLNKKDLFADKIHQTSINVCFKNYKGPPHDEIESREYIKERFKELAPAHARHDSKKMFCHFTCAIDRNQVENIFRDVQRIIIHQNLEVASLI